MRYVFLWRQRYSVAPTRTITHPKVSGLHFLNAMASEIKPQSTNYENLRILAEYCNVNSILKQIGLRWKMQLLYCISQGVYQFSKLKKVFPTISDQVLGKRIAELHEEGLIEKYEVDGTVPQQVRYSVTKKGHELIEIILALNHWGNRWR